MGPESEDSGEDLIVMGEHTDNFPERVLSGVKTLSKLVFNPYDADVSVVQCNNSLLISSTGMMTSHKMYTLPKGESFVGCVTWGRVDTVLFATKGKPNSPPNLNGLADSISPATS